MIANGTPVIFLNKYPGTARIEPKYAVTVNPVDRGYDIQFGDGEHTWAMESELVIR